MSAVQSVVKSYPVSRQALSRRVLVADDDAMLSTVLEFALHKSGFEVEVVNSGEAALQAMTHSRFSLLLLDLATSEPNSLKVCEWVRTRSMIPILVLSARNQENDLVDALNAGADGFVTKPFSPRALLARIHALLRRVDESAVHDTVASLHVQTGAFRLNVEERTLLTHPETIPLTRLELRVLQLLMLNADRPVSGKTLINEAWGAFNQGNRNMLKQVIFRLRRKLECDPLALASLITTEEGYAWLSSPSLHPLAAVQNSTDGQY